MISLDLMKSSEVRKAGDRSQGIQFQQRILSYLTKIKLLLNSSKLYFPIPIIQCCNYFKFQSITEGQESLKCLKYTYRSRSFVYWQNFNSFIEELYELKTYYEVKILILTQNDSSKGQRQSQFSRKSQKVGRQFCYYHNRFQHIQTHFSPRSLYVSVKQAKNWKKNP